MAKFNGKNQNLGQSTKMNPTLNHAGSVVHQLNNLETLFSKVLGSFFGESTFYENRTADSEFKELVTLIEGVNVMDKEYVLKVAELARLNKMISYPLQILTATMNMDRYKGLDFLGEDGRSKMPYYVDQIVRRQKDINEILASHIANYAIEYKDAASGTIKHKTRLPKQMREGLGKKMASFDKYKLSKGLDESAMIGAADAIKLLHPGQYNKSMIKIYKDIIEGKLTIGGDKIQIQTALTQKGQKKEQADNKDLTKAVFQSNVQALMRNLTSLLKNGVFNDEKVLEFACNKLRDKQAVVQSKLLPFRFLTAYRELEKFGSNRQVVLLKEAVEDALDASIENVDLIPGLTAVLVDTSGSMGYAISGNSSVTAADMALVLGAIAYKKGMGDLFVFANSCQQITVSRRSPVLEIVRAAKQVYVGGGTDLRTALNTITSHAKQHKLNYDNLIILSDNDCYGYNERTGTLTFGEHSWGSTNSSADRHIDLMIQEKVIKKVWINNLLGNNFAIVNTKKHTKNLITGFSEDFINIIKVYDCIGGNSDIRKVIDLMLEEKRKTAVND